MSAESSPTSQRQVAPNIDAIPGDNVESKSKVTKERSKSTTSTVFSTTQFFEQQIVEQTRSMSFSIPKKKVESSTRHRSDESLQMVSQKVIVPPKHPSAPPSGAPKYKPKPPNKPLPPIPEKSSSILSNRSPYDPYDKGKNLITTRTQAMIVDILLKYGKDQPVFYINDKKLEFPDISKLTEDEFLQWFISQIDTQNIDQKVIKKEVSYLKDKKKSSKKMSENIPHLLLLQMISFNYWGTTLIDLKNHIPTLFSSKDFDLPRLRISTTSQAEYYITITDSPKTYIVETRQPYRYTKSFMKEAVDPNETVGSVKFCRTIEYQEGMNRWKGYFSYKELELYASLTQDVRTEIEKRYTEWFPSTI